MNHLRAVQERRQNLIRQVAERIRLATYCRSRSVETGHPSHQRNTSRSSLPNGLHNACTDFSLGLGPTLTERTLKGWWLLLRHKRIDFVSDPIILQEQREEDSR